MELRVKIKQRIVLSFLLCLAAAIAMASPSGACSRIGPGPTVKDTFDQSAYVFTGTITKAELVDFIKLLPKELQTSEAAKRFQDSGMVFVKVYWRLDKTYKGRVPNVGSAIAVTGMCDVVFAIVGMPYVFSITSTEDFLKDTEGPEKVIMQTLFKNGLGKFISHGTFPIDPDSERSDEFFGELSKLTSKKGTK